MIATEQWKVFCTPTLYVNASQNAYEVVVYIRVEYGDQTISVSLVTAKTRVEPVQSIRKYSEIEIVGSFSWN